MYIFDQNLIERFKKGEIVIHNYPSNKELIQDVMQRAFPLAVPPIESHEFYIVTNNLDGRKTWGVLRPADIFPEGAQLVKLKDFATEAKERPAPMFKPNDRIVVVNHPNMNGKQFEIESGEYEQYREEYVYKMKAFPYFFTEKYMELIPDFTIGKNYEFIKKSENSWREGKLLAIIDHKYKYVFEQDEGIYVSNSIRVIAPKEKALRYFAIIDDKEEIQGIFGKESEAIENAKTDPNWQIILLTGKYIKK